MTSQILSYPVSTFAAINAKDPDGMLPLGEILERIRTGFFGRAKKQVGFGQGCNKAACICDLDNI